MKAITKYIIGIIVGLFFLSTMSYGQDNAPVLISIGNQSTSEDNNLTGLTVVFTDADAADLHTITVVSDESNVTMANLSGNISGSTYDLVPAADWNGTAQITVTVTDDSDGLLSDSETYTLTVNSVNDAPILGFTGDQNTEENNALTGLTVAFIDFDPTDLHVITVISNNPNITVENLSGNTSGSTYDLVPATDWNGVAQITVSVTDDGIGTLSDSDTYTLTVNAANDTPTVVTHGPSDIYQTIIVVFGEVTDEGGSPVTDRGMCLSLSPDPDLDDIVDHSGSGTGFFTSQFNYLMHSTTYYYRAFATNAEGTAYGDVLSAITMSSDMTLTETIIDVSCFGEDDGSIDISITGGVPPYSYSWSNGATTLNISSLAPGTYSVLIDDESNDQIAGTYEVLEPSAIEISGIVSNVTTCNGDATGSIQLIVAGGTPPYTIEWEHGPTDIYIPDLGAGTYDVLVTDASDCEQTASFNVYEPDVLTISVLDIFDETCIGCENGSIAVAASGGTGPYEFHWTGPDGFSSYQPFGFIDGLSSGDYYLEVTDINACTSEILQVYIGNPLTVTNTNDSGAGSLRNAIDSANARPGIDEIRFNMPDSWVYNIEPASSLPVITDTLVINGLSQPGTSSNTNLPGQGFNTDLNIVIEGSHAGEGATGLVIDAHNCEIIGLIINRFSQNGISVQGNNNQVRDCFIGVDSLGTQSTHYGNGVFGIQIDNANENIIHNCLISDNGGDEPNPGIVISGGSTLNQISGNLIGTDISGTLATPNSGSGINIGDAPGNIIGGLNDEDRNIIYGGIQLAGATTTGNKIIGNYLGPDVTGQVALGSGGGISIYSTASDNEIGPDNVISGNAHNGIQISGENTSNNRVFGNYIGIAADGNTVLPNISTNLVIDRASNNRIGGMHTDSTNVISGSSLDYGIHIMGSTATRNNIVGNFIGTNADGDQARGNASEGIVITDTATQNVIGPGNLISGNGSIGILIGFLSDKNWIYGNEIGTSTTPGLVISNARDGIYIDYASENLITANTICGAGNGWENSGSGIAINGGSSNNNNINDNYIGTNFENATGMGNGIHGIDIRNGAHSTIIGPYNTIAGNTYDGIHLENINTDSTRIFENYIGTAVGNPTDIGNGSMGIVLADSIRFTTIGPGNIVSGNGMVGIQIHQGSSNNRIIGNKVGTTEDGMDALGNSGIGLMFVDSPDNIIGGINPEDRNLLSGNGMEGLVLAFSPTSGNLVIGNYIGTDATGNALLQNGSGDFGINGAPNNIIGGLAPGERNVIASMAIGNSGAKWNKVIGNYIGLRADGQGPLSQEYYGAGVFISETSDNIIGPGNVISGLDMGIFVHVPNGGESDSTARNRVIGNLIGTDPDGTGEIPNRVGVFVEGAIGTVIGGIAEGDRNIISGSDDFGIQLVGPATGTRIENNYIGTDKTGESAIANGQGITTGPNATDNYIGTGNNGIGNLIAYNTNEGITLGSDQNYVLGNVIHGNGESGNDAGISITGSHNTIGGPMDADRNYLYGNGSGIMLFSEADSNLIEGNYFGTDHEGREDLTEGHTGIFIFGNDNIVRNNLISGYAGSGIHISRSDPATPASRNWIEGNTIGLNASGDAYIPNRYGISIDSSDNNTVLSNVIAGNTDNGITIFDDRAVNNHISQNSIFSNGELGIDLLVGTWGVTENDIDPLDPDIGANNLQNYPVLDSISFTENKVTVGGYLRTKSDSIYIIEFFASGVGDDTGYGEGEFYLGCDTVITNDTGYVYFVTTLPIQGYGAQVITATATDEDGNTSEFSQVIGGEKDQVLAEMPFRYTLNSEGLSTVPLADYQNAIRSSFQTWDDIPTAEIEMFDAGSSDQKYASATDGLNLISFQDDRFPFAKGVLAVTAKTLRVTSGGTIAEILDADIVFNPAFIHDPVHSFAVLEEGDTITKAFDIQSVTTHEIGHILGMIHSGVYSSTMFFMLDYGTTERELDADDMAWASFRYPGEYFQSTHGLLSGRITYGDLGDVGDPSSHPPVAGAMVLAVNTDSPEMIHAYTDADGNYTVPIPMQESETDEYWIYIQPLDGDVYGTSLKPANISPYIYSHTIFTDFPEEFYDELESADDNPRDGAEILVSVGAATKGKDLITNRDRTRPTLIGTSPAQGDTGIAVSPTVVMKFSEPVDIYSFNDTSCYFESSGVTVGGEYTLLADSTHIVLMKPVESLLYSTVYTIHIDSSITDLKNNLLDTAYTLSFTTIPPDTIPPSVYDVIPADSLTQVDVTKKIKVFFSEPMNKISVETDFLLMTADSTLVEGDIAWDLANKEMTYSPDYSLEEETDYMICLSTMASDLSGNAMEYDTTFTFSTVDVAKPQILYLGPAHGSTGITVKTPVVVKFSEPMDLTSITPSSFSLTGTAGPVTGDYQYLDDDRTIVFIPDTLYFDESYTVRLSIDISDKSNPKQYLKDTTTTFRTSPVIVLPHIGYMVPPFGAVGAQVTIVGSGFDPVPWNNNVMFNGADATPYKATLESLTLYVPNLALDGLVTVSVNGDVSDNSFEFDVIPANTDPSYNVIASSKSGSRTRAVVINPNAGYAYVTNWGDNTVTPIDISEYIPVPGTNIPVGIEPMDIDLNPAGTLAYVTNYLSNSVSVIGTNPGVDSTFHTVTKDIQVGYHPYGIAASSDKKVYVANNESEYVSVIDVDPNSGGFDHVIANVKTGSRNRSLVVTPDAALILVTGEDGVTIIDRNPISPTFNDVIARASKGSSTRHINITPDAALALATTDDGIILIIDIFQPRGTEFGNVIASVKTGSSARNINISPDAMYVYITNPDENTVSVYQLDYSIIPGYGASLSNPEGLTHITTIKVDDTPYAIVGHPNSEYILVTHDSEEGGVSKIGIEEESVDLIHTLGELIASVGNAIEDDNLTSKNGNKLLTDLNKTLSRVNSDQLESAIDHLDNFIMRVQRYMSRGEIQEDLGNAWLEAAYRIREQLVKDLEAQQIPQGGSGKKSSGITTLTDSQKASSNISELQRKYVMKLENRPNPFSYHTQIDFEIPKTGQTKVPVIMRVFNTSGQVVKTLVHMDMEPGRYSVIWNSDLDDGGLVPDGIYLLELMTPDQRKAITISVIK